MPLSISLCGFGNRDYVSQFPYVRYYVVVKSFNILVSPRGSMCFRGMIFSLSGPCELLFLLCFTATWTLSCGECNVILVCVVFLCQWIFLFCVLCVWQCLWIVWWNNSQYLWVGLLFYLFICCVHMLVALISCVSLLSMVLFWTFHFTMYVPSCRMWVMFFLFCQQKKLEDVEDVRHHFLYKIYNDNRVNTLYNRRMKASLIFLIATCSVNVYKSNSNSCSIEWI